MSDEKAESLYAWITPEKYERFIEGRRISKHCELCEVGDSWYIDTGSTDGFIPRLTSMPQTPSGFADTSQTRELPVVRAICVNCGNIRHHAMFVFEMWKQTYDNLGMEWGRSGLIVEDIEDVKPKDPFGE